MKIQNQSANLPDILSSYGLLQSALNLEKDLPAWQFCTDSRNIQPGSWFIALKGANFDGHSFLEQASKHGAGGFIVSEIPEGFSNKLPILVVTDTLKAYQAIANHYRKSLNITTIAITGSNGKTTTKEMLFAVLSTKYRTTSTHANENNEIGVPKTILRAAAETEVLVLECGMRGLNQIKELTEIAEPDLAAITSIGTAHIGLLGSRENIAKAKSEIFRFMPKNKTAFLPFNEPLLKPFAKERDDLQFKLFGDFENGRFEDERLQFKYKNEEFYLYTPNLALASNACLVIDIAKEMGLSKIQIQEGLSQFKPIAGRGTISQLKTGTTIIDETYNANPDSTVALAQSLACLGKSKKKILVLGEMAELGDLKNNLLEQMAKKIVPSVDEIILIGEENKELASKFPNAQWLSSTDKAFDFLYEHKDYYLNSNCLIGFKASRISKLEELVKKLEEL